MSTTGRPSLTSLRPEQVPPRPVGDLAALLGVPVSADGGGRLVRGVTLDSRAVRPGDLYAALPGSRVHGARFAADAVAAGAVAVLTDPAGTGPAVACGVPVLVVDRPRAVLGEVAAQVYGHPARRLSMLGVTGTNGKTTVTFLLDGALRLLGRRTGLVGTVETRVLDERVPSVRTTPEAPDVQALLALMAERGASACSMEVSSHALAMGRVDGVVFDVAGFTNLSRDHLDFHPTMEDYFATKAGLFTPERARRGVVCVDDAWGRRLAERAGVPVVRIATGPGAGDAEWRASDARPDGTGTAFTLAGPDVPPFAVRSPLPGSFNVANTALALVMLVELGMDADRAVASLAAAPPVPGRMERVSGGGAPGEPLAVVDYAHTPDAVAAAVAALTGTGRPLVVVLGAGGDRDRDKRPMMGAAAAGAADVLIVTDDNPRSEDPAAIRAAVLDGARRAGGRARVLEIPDRAEAVAAAVDLAWGDDAGGSRGSGGTVLVAGKGHERGQESAGRVTPFDDRGVLAAALAGRAGRGPAAAGGAPGREESLT